MSIFCVAAAGARRVQMIEQVEELRKESRRSDTQKQTGYRRVGGNQATR